VLFETWLVPAEGYLVDRFGPRIVVLAGGFLAGLAWLRNSYASTLAMLYLAQIIGGIGASAVYGTAVGNALKWFPDHRGFATGLTAAGFGIGSALTIIPIHAQRSHAAILRLGIGLFRLREHHVVKAACTHDPGTSALSPHERY
jgi:MFS transporter, OFA family, oxalate/formate antiporter